MFFVSGFVAAPKTQITGLKGVLLESKSLGVFTPNPSYLTVRLRVSPRPAIFVLLSPEQLTGAFLAAHSKARFFYTTLMPMFLSASSHLRQYPTSVFPWHTIFRAKPCGRAFSWFFRVV